MSRDGSRAAVLAWIALAAVPAGKPASAQPAEGPRDRVVAKVEEMLETIKNNKPPAGAGMERIFSFTEQEANDYIAARILSENEKAERGGKLTPAALKTAVVAFLPGRIIEVEAVGRIEPGAVKEWAPELPFADALGRWLASENTVRVRGLLTSAKGKAYYRTEWARLNGHGVPDSWILAITERVGRAQRPPVDLTRMLDLPNGIEKVEIGFHSLKIRVRLGAPRP